MNYILYGKNIKVHIDLYSEKYRELLDKFNCGNESINEYLKKNAIQDFNLGKGVTKLFLSENKDRIVGFYTLCCSAMMIGKKNVSIQLSPAVEIKMFAIDREYQGIPWSENEDDGTFSDNLFCKPIGEIYNLSESICGVTYAILYAVPMAINFYEKNGFQSFEEIMVKDNSRYLEGTIPLFFSL